MDELKNKKDEYLIQEILKNPDLYGEIIFRYQKKIINYISKISKISREDAEDLTQDIFLSAYENLNSFDSSLSFSSWIYRIAHNRTINFWKKHERESHNINLEDNQFLVELIFNENSVEKDIEDINNKELIAKILQRIPPKYKEILILQFLENKDYKEMSDILEKSMGTIATMVSRAKKQFKKELEKMEKEFYHNKKK